MSKFIFIFILFFTGTIKSNSQTYFKIKTGINFSKAVYLNKNNNDLVKPIRKLKSGFTGGIAIHHFLNKIISVQTEILYSQKGLKTEQPPYATTYNTMNYAEIPISGHYALVKTRDSYFNIYIGGYGAYWTDGKYKRKDYYTGEISSVNVDFHNPDYKYSRIDAGILAGCIYNIKKLDFFLRYTHSMTGSSELNTDALSNKVISFGINYVLIK